MDGVSVARCPGHISGYFRRISGDTPRETGSAGAGIVIEEGVIARAAPAPSPRVRRFSPDSLPGRGGLPLIESAMEILGVSAEVTTESALPAGAGFGLSAAALLASISALSTLFDLGLSRPDIASLAHEIEVNHRTGLGDVAACMGGGVECRRGPGVGAAIERVALTGRIIHAVSLGPIPTPLILGDPASMGRIDRAFPGRCPRDIEDLLGLSRSFAEASGLITPPVREVLSACDRAGVRASMTMLGEGVFALGDGAPSALSPFGRVYALRIAKDGFSEGKVVR
jgi:pantoate kinase